MSNNNSNCLQGMECPKCKAPGPFRIAAVITVLVHDDGTEDEGGDYEWLPASFCECVECAHKATIKDFTVKQKKRNK